MCIRDRATAEQDKICIDTVVQCDVLFLDRNEELQSIRCEIPVHLEEEAPGMTACMQVCAQVVCEPVAYTQRDVYKRQARRGRIEDGQ